MDLGVITCIKFTNQHCRMVCAKIQLYVRGTMGNEKAMSYMFKQTDPIFRWRLRAAYRLMVRHARNKAALRVVTLSARQRHYCCHATAALRTQAYTVAAVVTGARCSGVMRQETRLRVASAALRVVTAARVRGIAAHGVVVTEGERRAAWRLARGAALRARRARVSVTKTTNNMSFFFFH